MRKTHILTSHIRNSLGGGLGIAALPVLVLAIAFWLSACGNSSKLTNDQLLQSALAAATGPKADWQKAKLLASKAVKQNKDDARAHVMYALSLEQCGQVENAIDEIRNAVELDPKNFLAQFTKGRLLYEQKRFGDCIAPLMEAYKIHSENDKVIILLAKSLTELGRYKDAAAFYATLVLKNPLYKDKPEPYNELAILYVKQKEYQTALSCFIKAYEKAPTDHIVILNLGILNDVNLNNPSEAVKYYTKYQEITLRNPELEPVREKLRRRIEALQKTGRH